MMALGIIGVICMVVILLPLEILLNGFVLTKLWFWFINPIFGLALLTLPQAMGLSLIISFLTHQIVDTEPKKESATTKIATSLVRLFITPLLFLLIGFIIKQFMG